MSLMYDEHVKEAEYVQLAVDILGNARNELYLNMRFLSAALAALAFQADAGVAGTGTDGAVLYFHPDSVVSCFRRGRTEINRTYLHTVIHCLFCHLWNRRDRERGYWDLACDIAAEYIIDGLHIRAVHRPASMLRREYYRKLEASGGVVTAERVYRMLVTEESTGLLRSEFTVDDHQMWEQEDLNSPSPHEQQKKWDDIRDRMQTEIELFSKEGTEDYRSLEEQAAVQNRQRYDYREFLRKFSVLKEEMQIDPDAFDMIFYHYGMELYGNMPLIEPQETREVKKVEDFVVVVDTSMSCKGELICKFLEETYRVLSESESFFRKINIHIIQCDDRIQEDVRITGQKDLEDYMRHFTIRGYGGTDFRPPFAYVQELLRQGSFVRLRGLIYFTDGYGTFPVKKPPYETAFVFMKEDYRDIDVPPWAVKLIISEEDLRDGSMTEDRSG